MNIERDIKNNDGSIETLLIISNDNVCPLDLNKTYKLANKIDTNQNKFVSKFKNSIFGSDIGVNADGFSNIAILATILAVASVLVMYVLWRL